MQLIARTLQVPGACLLLTFAAILPAAAKPPHGEAQRWVEAQLFFGLSRPGGEVTSREWQSFVDDVITPAFPDGLTILDGYGQWKNAQGQVVHEGCRVLILLYHPSGASRRSIESIRATYKRRFQQESVLRVTGPVDVSF